MAEETRLLTAFIVVDILEHVNQGPVRLALMLCPKGFLVPLFDFSDPLGLLKVRERLALIPCILGSRSRIGLFVRLCEFVEFRMAFLQADPFVAPLEDRIFSKYS